jgi:hypothetical protein
MRKHTPSLRGALRRVRDEDTIRVLLRVNESAPKVWRGLPIVGPSTVVVDLLKSEIQTLDEYWIVGVDVVRRAQPL